MVGCVGLGKSLEVKSVNCPAYRPQTFKGWSTRGPRERERGRSREKTDNRKENNIMGSLICRTLSYGAYFHKCVFMCVHEMEAMGLLFEGRKGTRQKREAERTLLEMNQSKVN